MRARGAVARLSCALALVSVAACADDPAPRVPVVQWATPPDRADLTPLADACTEAAGGSYRIEIETLPDDVGLRRIEILDRLRARDGSIDLVGVDTSLTTELAEADLLAPLPEEVLSSLDGSTRPEALAASTVGDTVATAPWWYEPYLLWYRGSLAERAGLDVTAPITWDELITATARLGGTLQIADADGLGTSAWLTGLVASAGGDVVTDLDSAAGEQAAAVVRLYADARIGPGPSPDSLAAFAGPTGAFLVAPASVEADPELAIVSAELSSTGYPVIDPSTAAAPLTGVGLAVPRGATDPAAAFEAITCLTSAESAERLADLTGHTPAQRTGDEVVLAPDADPVDLPDPRADVVGDALAGGVPEPAVAQFDAFRRSVDDRWSPVTAVVGATPARTAAEIRSALAGDLR
ncbi:extracellular solute-binding protein [Aeromicrobium marinum]|uniref:extracellular solute-binding protein n=1 Tax=Aeromicrobium marinum TaxID=219314 RepID=UPI0012EA4AAC|nr:extracellular solute-binding protein [Aeromicrobium marinum]